MKLYSLFFLLIPLLVSAQNVQVIDQITLGGSNSEIVSSTVYNVDGTTVLSGNTTSGISGDKTVAGYGGSDIWIIKLNSDYSIAWQYSYGGSGTEMSVSIKSTSDGGYIFCCSSDSPISGNKTISNIGLNDYWVVKLDMNGIIEWQTVLGGSGNDSPVEIVENSAGVFIIAGSSNSPVSGNKTQGSYGLTDFWEVCIDGDGNFNWDKTIGGSDVDAAWDVFVDSQDNVVISGVSSSNISGLKTENSYGYSDYWIVKTDPGGNFLWDKTLGGNDDEGQCFISELNNNIYFSGYSFSDISGLKSESSYGSSDYWIGKLDSDGNLLWEKTYGGSDADGSIGNVSTNDFQFIVMGSSMSNQSGTKTENSIGGSQDFWLVSVDTNGTFNWDKTIGGDQTELGIGILEKSDNNYLLYGGSESNISGHKDENSRGLSDYWLVEISTNVSVGENEKNQIIIYPNPAQDQIFFRQAVNNVQLVDNLGQVLLNGTDESTTSLQLGLISPGIYHVRFVCEGIEYVQRIIVN